MQLISSWCQLPANIFFCKTGKCFGSQFCKYWSYLTTLSFFGLKCQVIRKWILGSISQRYGPHYYGLQNRMIVFCKPDAITNEVRWIINAVKNNQEFFHKCFSIKLKNLAIFKITIEISFYYESHMLAFSFHF